MNKSVRHIASIIVLLVTLPALASRSAPAPDIQIEDLVLNAPVVAPVAHPLGALGIQRRPTIIALPSLMDLAWARMARHTEREMKEKQRETVNPTASQAQTPAPQTSTRE